MSMFKQSHSRGTSPPTAGEPSSTKSTLGAAVVATALATAPTPSIDGSLRAASYQHNPNLERVVRADILHSVRARLEKVGSAVGRLVPEKAKDAATRDGDVSVDVAAAVSDPFTPVSIGITLQKLRTSAAAAHNDPACKPQARVDLLLGLIDLGSSAVSLTAAGHPVTALVTTLVVTGTKTANAIRNLVRPGPYSQDKDRLRRTASVVAELPGFKTALDLALKGIHQLDRQTVDAAKRLKDLFAPEATREHKRQGRILLDKFHKLYSNYYPKDQQEKKQSMMKYLADTNDRWSLTVFEKGGEVYGGFTCFLQNDPKFGRHMYVEQVLPPHHLDPEGNRKAWEHIKESAKNAGCNRIWLEKRAVEHLPEGFHEIDVYHAQPALAGRIAPVGIDNAPRDKNEEQLRMSVCTIDPKLPIQPTFKEYYEIITKETGTWALPSDPVWQKLAALPRTDEPMNLLPVA